MGCDCKICLPSDARLRDVASVIGIAAGCPFHRRTFSGNSGWSVHVEDVKVEQSGPYLLTCPVILIKRKTVDGDEGHHVMFHYEPGGMHGKYNLLLPPSTPFWIAIADRLTRFFGGWVDVNDCDSTEKDWERKKPREWNDPEENTAWYRFQEDMEEVKPVTLEDLERFSHPGYPLDSTCHNG